MQRPIPAGWRGYAVVAHASAAAASAVALTPILLLTSCTLPPEVQSAWNRYIKAEAAYESCNARRSPRCDAERAAFNAARDNYHAAKDVQP
jgi:hypothetical protein